MDTPPTRDEWLLDWQMRGGHTPAETIAWASWVADSEDELTVFALAPVVNVHLVGTHEFWSYSAAATMRMSKSFWGREKGCVRGMRINS